MKILPAAGLWTRWPGLMLAGLLAAAPLAPAQAQLAAGSNGPVDITADELEVLNTRCLAIWRGSAEALQDTSRLRADVLTIRYAPARPARTGAAPTCGELQGLDAQGSVFYLTPAQRVRANAAVYDAASDTITLTGDVVAAQGQNVVRGERLVIQLATGEAKMETSARGAGTPGRVRGVFFPNQTQAQPASKR